jgi:hypothetical protein
MIRGRHPHTFSSLLWHTDIMNATDFQPRQRHTLRQQFYRDVDVYIVF